ncbi:uncharacterized protein LOC115885554 [Sitophilus oryzae]|uniref:Uncharacterized protein LOC115885554 n=1 Tax=Sitophilus oryzae TaxID=7048 RepID=A0A6J2YAZ2_SITOR|nr:uncharacterized protein LOC115885554 [Sitophilus oryzae]
MRKSGGEKRNTKCNKEKQEQQPHNELLQQLQQESQPVQHPQQQQHQQEEQTFDDYLKQFLDEFKQIELSVVEARETLALQQLVLQIREERLKKCEHIMGYNLSLLEIIIVLVKTGRLRKYQENEEQSRISQKQHSTGSALPNLKRMLVMDETNTERRRKKTVSSSSSTTIATLSGSLSHRVAPSPVEKLGLAQHIQIWMKSYRKNQEDGAAAVAKAEAAVKKSAHAPLRVTRSEFSEESRNFLEEGQRIEIDLEEYNQETDSEEDTLPDSSSWWAPCQPPDVLAGPADSSWMWVPEIVDDDDERRSRLSLHHK